MEEDVKAGSCVGPVPVGSLPLAKNVKHYWRGGASQPSRSFERNFLSSFVRSVSAHARLLTRHFQIFTHFHTR